MVVGFVPLFFATATFARVGYENLQRENAERLGRSVAAGIAAERLRLPRREFLDELGAQVQSGAVQAIGVYQRSGELDARVGEPEFLGHLAIAGGSEPRSTNVTTASGPAVLSYTPSSHGGVATVTRVAPVTLLAAQLSRLMGLYMAVGALMVLIVAYFALTRWIVRPIVDIERAADRVAGGSRRMEPIERAPRELRRLSHSLTTMTRTLVEEEEALRRKVDEVEEATRQLEQSHASLIRSERMASVGRLSAGLAHEVGNPISSLMGLLDLMLDGDLTPDEQRDFLQRMKKETARIDRVLADLLTYARPASPAARSGTLGPAGMRIERGDVGAALDDVLALLKPQRDMADVRFSHRIEANLPTVPLPTHELTQILLNLLMNAADACKRHGMVRVTARRIEDDVHGAGVEIVVEDDGAGIDPTVRDSLFEPFVSTKEIGKGTGLGLSVTRGLIESAGGSVHVDPDVQQGARFVVRFPLELRPTASERSGLPRSPA